MDAKKTQGWLVVSVDVAASCGATDAVHRTMRGLRPLLGQHAIPVTWALDELASPLAAVILDGQDTHEIALRADAQWSSPNASRSAFYQGLQYRLQQATVARTRYASIVSPHAQVPDHLDLLSKFGITAVRTTPAARRRWPLNATAQPPVALRFGIWETPVSVDLCRDGLRATRAAIRKATRQGTTVVVRVDAEQMPTRAIEGLVHAAQQAVSSGRLHPQTLTSAVDRLARRRQTTPAQSILRAA